MANERFVISKYSVNVSPGATASGRIIFDRWISCDTIDNSGSKHSCLIYFLNPDSPSKTHQLRQLQTKKRVALYLPANLYQSVIDLLRVGQRPIAIHIDKNRPEGAKISSSPELMRQFDRTLLIPKS